MKQTKGDVTKERIIEEAVDIFVRDGFAASRTNEIAKAADVSEATVFKYFSSKQGLLDSVVSLFIKQVSKKVIVEPLDIIFEQYKNDAPEVLLKIIFMDRIRLFQRYKKFAIVAFAESRFNGEIREKIITQLFPDIRRVGEKIVEHYKKKGIFRQELDAWITIRTAMMSIIGMLVSTEFLGIPPRGGSFEAELDIIIEFILLGAVTDQWQSEKLRGEEHEQK